MSPRHVALLPGASGAAAFWAPVAARLPGDWPTRLWSWPGAGDEPADPRVSGFADLIALVADATPAGSDVVAQSMGGVVALGLAIRWPQKVRRLVLVATSGGLSSPTLGPWREAYRAAYPSAAPWVTGDRLDLGAEIPRVTAPTLLVWGGADPISPVDVGRRLAGLLVDARLVVVPGGDHDLARERPDEVAALVAGHLG